MREANLQQHAENMSVDGRVHILHDPEHKYTLAYIITGADDNSITACAAGAFCSSRDMFCKKKGRTIATGRLVNLDHTFRTEDFRGQCGYGAVTSGDLLLDCAMPVRAEQWRWVDAQVVEAMNVDKFDDIPW